MPQRTLLQLRRAIGRDLGDVTLLKATAAGSTTSFIDTNNLWKPDNAFRGQTIYFTGGTANNRGDKRVISSSLQSSATVNWSLAADAATASADEAELWNTRGIGWDPAEVNGAINSALSVASTYCWIPAVATISAVFDYDAGTFTLPGSSVAVYAVEWQDDDDYWHDIPQSNRIGSPGWKLRAGTRTVDLRGDWAAMADGQSLRVRHYTETAELEEDDDATGVNMEWIIAEAKAKLLGSSFDRAPNERGLAQRWQMAQQEAAYKRGGLNTRIKPNTVVVEG